MTLFQILTRKVAAAKLRSHEDCSTESAVKPGGNAAERRNNPVRHHSARLAMLAVCLVTGQAATAAQASENNTA